MKYKNGDIVRVKSKEQILNLFIRDKFDDNRYILEAEESINNLIFVDVMFQYCGKSFIIKQNRRIFPYTYGLIDMQTKELIACHWHDTMLENGYQLELF